jgi:hypothetical protein
MKSFVTLSKMLRKKYSDTFLMGHVFKIPMREDLKARIDKYLDWKKATLESKPL